MSRDAAAGRKSPGCELVGDSANQVLHHVLDTCIRVAGANTQERVSV